MVEKGNPHLPLSAAGVYTLMFVYQQPSNEGRSYCSLEVFTHSIGILWVVLKPAAAPCMKLPGLSLSSPCPLL